MAEAMLRAVLPPESGWTVSSAGLSAAPGMPASEEAASVLREIGVDLSRHSSRRVTREMLRKADLVIPMTREHRAQLIAMEPSVEAKSCLLLSFLLQPPCNRNLPDPVGGTLATYRACRDLVSDCLPSLLDYLL